MVTITRKSHPAIFEICQEVLHDNGAMNRENPEEIRLPYWGHPQDFELAEKRAKLLSARQRFIIAAGEETEKDNVIGDDPYLALLDVVVGRWFEEGLQ